jgi:hypothetical protein
MHCVYCSLDLSYNQPRLSSCAEWNPQATSLTSVYAVNFYPSNIFINRADSIYVTGVNRNEVLLFTRGQAYPSRNFSDGLLVPQSVFATINGDVYIDNGYSNRKVSKWSENATSATFVMSVSDTCQDLFIDIYDSIYCSMNFVHKVVKRSLNSNMSTLSNAAGNGTSGSSSALLDTPCGIFVNINLDLYVADCGNSRVQLFRRGKLEGVTVLGNGSNHTISVSCPIDVVLDADGYLFVVDFIGNRLLGSGSNGFRCIVGCTGYAGSASNQLWYPTAVSFDSYGNILIVDMNNDRLQNFTLSKNSCGENEQMTFLLSSSARNRANHKEYHNYSFVEQHSTSMSHHADWHLDVFHTVSMSSDENITICITYRTDRVDHMIDLCSCSMTSGLR